MQKHYILDTNVLLHDPGALLSFQDNEVLVPIQVVEEVDHFKRQVSELGRNARQVSKLLDHYRAAGSLANGVELASGGRLRVLLESPRADLLPSGLTDNVDNALVAAALELKEQNPDHPVVIVTMDTNLRIKADALGIAAQDFEAGRVAADEIYLGHSLHQTTAAVLDEIRGAGKTPFPASEPHPNAPHPNAPHPNAPHPNTLHANALFPNEYLQLESNENGARPVLARVDAAGTHLQAIKNFEEQAIGVVPRNREQHYALDALLDPEVRLVTLMGKAGTGKTFLAVAAGLAQVLGHPNYPRLLISRPIFPVGRDVGYLPGDIDAKMSPWMQPIYDNLLVILEKSRGKDAAAILERTLRDGLISVEPVTYIRGRSIAGQFIVIDEAQNLTPLEVKTIVTRVGEGTKIVLTGDVDQIDNPYVDAWSNGFVHLVQKLKHSGLVGHVALCKGERSALAELAANTL